MLSHYLLISGAAFFLKKDALNITSKDDFITTPWQSATVTDSHFEWGGGGVGKVTITDTSLAACASHLTDCVKTSPVTGFYRPTHCPQHQAPGKLPTNHFTNGSLFLSTHLSQL